MIPTHRLTAGPAWIEAATGATAAGSPGGTTPWQPPSLFREGRLMSSSWAGFSGLSAARQTREQAAQCLCSKQGSSRRPRREQVAWHGEIVEEGDIHWDPPRPMAALAREHKVENYPAYNEGQPRCNRPRQQTHRRIRAGAAREYHR